MTNSKSKMKFTNIFLKVLLTFVLIVGIYFSTIFILLHLSNLFGGQRLHPIQVYQTINHPKFILPPPIYPSIDGLNEEMLNSIAYQIHQRNSTDINYVTIVTDHNAVLAKNWLCNFKHLKADKFSTPLYGRVLIISLSETFCTNVMTSELIGMRCLSITSSPQANSQITTTQQHKQWNLFVYSVLYTLINNNIPIFYFVPETIWLKDPYHLFKNATTIDDADIILVPKERPDQIYYYNTKPMLIYPSNKSKLFLKDAQQQIKSLKESYDEHSMNEIIDDSCKVQRFGVVCRTFDFKQIADKTFFDMATSNKRSLHPFLLLNELEGVKPQKIVPHMKKNMVWFLDANEKCGGVKDTFNFYLEE